MLIPGAEETQLEFADFLCRADVSNHVRTLAALYLNMRGRFRWNGTHQNYVDPLTAGLCMSSTSWEAAEGRKAENLSWRIVFESTRTAADSTVIVLPKYGLSFPKIMITKKYELIFLQIIKIAHFRFITKHSAIFGASPSCSESLITEQRAEQTRQGSWTEMAASDSAACQLHFSFIHSSVAITLTSLYNELLPENNTNQHLLHFNC